MACFDTIKGMTLFALKDMITVRCSLLPPPHDFLGYDCPLSSFCPTDPILKNCGAQSCTYYSVTGSELEFLFMYLPNDTLVCI